MGRRACRAWALLGLGPPHEEPVDQLEFAFRTSSPANPCVPKRIDSQVRRFQRSLTFILQPNSNGLKPNSNGLQPTSNGLQPHSNDLAMASNLIAMASNLLAMDSNLIAMA